MVTKTGREEERGAELLCTLPQAPLQSPEL